MNSLICIIHKGYGGWADPAQPGPPHGPTPRGRPHQDTPKTPSNNQNPQPETKCQKGAIVFKPMSLMLDLPSRKNNDEQRPLDEYDKKSSQITT